MILTHRQSREGDRIPYWYGVSYRDFETGNYVAHLYPFNWLVWLWREFRFRYWHVKKKSRWVEELHKAYLSGLRHRGD